MTVRDPFSVLVEPDALRRWGNVALLGTAALTGLLVLYGIWKTPMLLWVLAILPPACAAALWVFQRPLVNLGCVLLGFILVLEHEEGFSVIEVGFGLYYLGYLLYWAITRFLLYRERQFFTVEDYALLIFFLCVAISIPFAVLYGASTTLIISELVSLAVLVFYFPVREACVRYRHGVWVVLVVFVLIGMYTGARNAYMLYKGLGNAEFIWQVAKGRIILNDYVLMATSVFTLAFAITAPTTRRLIFWLPAFLATFGGLLVTQSRGYWLTFSVAALVLFIFVSTHEKRRMVILGVVGLLAAGVVGMVFLGDLFEILLAGLINRIFSIESAATSDLSVVNRWYETAAAWQMIKVNPILGYGPGVVYPFFDLAEMLSLPDSFVHNGYVHMWFKYGIVGMVMLVVFLVGTMVRGFRLSRRATASSMARRIGLAGGAIIVGTLPAIITNNPLFLSDSLVMIGIAAGLVAGMHQRTRLEAT
ncbi:MAG: hypothetical protein RhofKO_26910 [Rhodothermales bacterium]